MRSTVLVRGAALVATAAVVGLSASPASAATVAQGSATALSVDVAGTGATDSGTYTATNDGKTSSSTGSNKPLITALANQQAIQPGTLAQDAVARVKNGHGYSAACSGLAGDGATLVAVGSGNCLSGGNTLDLGLGTLDLSKVQIVSSDLFQGLDKQLQTQLTRLIPGVDLQQALSDVVTQTLTPVLSQLGKPGLRADLGAVQSHCVANGGKVSGDSSLAGAGIVASVPGAGDVTIAKLPVDPDVNEKVVTDLSGVIDSVLDGVDTQLTEGLDGDASQLTAVTGALRTQLVDGVISQIGAQLKPIEDNLLDITLNKQTTGPGSIEVTALDLAVAPAATQLTGSPLAHITIGTSTCGPNNIVARAVPAAAPPKAAPAAPKGVPTAVPAGLASYDDGQAGRVALVALLLLAAAGAGVGAYVRSVRRG